MNTLRKSILIGLTVIGMGATSVAALAETSADQSPAAKHGDMHGKMGEMMAEHMAKAQAKLHDELKLTAAQEPAWAAFTASMTPSMPAAPAAKMDHEAMAKMSAPEHLEKMLARSKEHQAKMEAHLASLKTFYAALTPEQQKIMDKHVMRMMHRHMAMRGMMMRHHGMQNEGWMHHQG